MHCRPRSDTSGLVMYSWVSLDAELSGDAFLGLLGAELSVILAGWWCIVSGTPGMRGRSADEDPRARREKTVKVGMPDGRMHTRPSVPCYGKPGNGIAIDWVPRRSPFPFLVAVWLGLLRTRDGWWLNAPGVGQGGSARLQGWRREPFDPAAVSLGVSDSMSLGVQSGIGVSVACFTGLIRLHSGHAWNPKSC